MHDVCELAAVSDRIPIRRNRSTTPLEPIQTLTKEQACQEAGASLKLKLICRTDLLLMFAIVRIQETESLRFWTHHWAVEAGFQMEITSMTPARDPKHGSLEILQKALQETFQGAFKVLQRTFQEALQEALRKLSRKLSMKLSRKLCRNLSKKL